MRYPRLPPIEELNAARRSRFEAAAMLEASWTGRYLIGFAPGEVDRGRELLERLGLRVADPVDRANDALSEDDARDADVLLMRHVEIALLSGEHGQIDLVRASDSGVVPASPIQRVTIERAVYGAQDPFDLEGPVPDDWHLLVTRVAQSGFSGGGVRVAVLDTGLDFDHADFFNRVPDTRRKPFVAGAATAADDHGHGTHCAGLVTGPSVPAAGARYGVAPEAELCIGKVLNFSKVGAQGWVIAGIDWAITLRCAIASVSLGTPVAPGTPFDHLYEQAGSRALAAGLLVIAAAGNDSARPGLLRPVASPADCPSITAVGAVDAAFGVAPFSNAAMNDAGGVIDLVAPGLDVHSAWRGGITTRRSGTSQAAAIAAGIAVLRSQATGLRGAALHHQLRIGVRALDAAPRDVGQGLALAP